MGWVRIIGGRWRGRRLRTPAGLFTRPTSDKVREAVFDLLGDIAGARAADLFAGSGALGIEAVSRGASEALLVDFNPSALRAMQANLEALGRPAGLRMSRRDLGRGLDFLIEAGPFDLILADPPYDRGWPLRLLERLPAGALKPQGRLMVQSSLDEAPAQTRGWSLEKQRIYGQTVISILTLEAK